MKENKWYNLDSNHVIKKLETDSKIGLSNEEASKRQGEHGKNELPAGQTEPKWRKFLKHFHDVLIYVLLAAAIITFVLGHYIDTVIILLVAIINAVIGYVQENKAEKALDGIRNMLSLKANVIRDGQRAEIHSNELVPGDIVLLSAGDKVPADLRILRADNLKVEESPLTGESVSVEKNADTLPEDTVLGDKKNMVFSGTSIASGSGMGVVVATGIHTELGKINTSMTEVEEIQTPLLKQTAKFGKMISIVILFGAAAMFVFGLMFHDYETAELLLAVIGLAVAAIPEGLPAILSIILALGVQTMAKNNAIVRNLPSVETLGAVSVICSDKTGTLTKNEMTVTSVILANHEYDVTGTGYAPEGKVERDGKEVKVEADENLINFLTCVKTVNEASLYKDDQGHWVINGEPTESCLITLVGKANHPIQRLEALSKIPFDSAYKYMACLVEMNGERVVLVKGAPDRLFDMANMEVGSEERVFWEDKMTKQAKMGKRLIGAAMKKVRSDQETIDHADVQSGLMFLGLAGIIDPPREEAILAVEECKRAGIVVKMITGDHRETAIAIGKELSIGDGTRAIEGRELDKMTPEELKQAAIEYDVFARTSPENKLQLVQALQEHGHICAMTGDGVNDAPALKRADIGVAMGIKGTEVSKDASQMVLVDDNFHTIVSAVREGRRVYDNLKKTILFILPTNGAEAFLIFASILFGTMMPLTPVQILWVNMITAVTISLAIAFEKLEKGTMDRPPREAETKLLSGYYIFRIVFVSLLIGGGILLMNADLINNGYDQAIVNTVTLQAIVLAQLFHLYNCRSERNFALSKDFFKNKVAFLVSGLLIVIQLGVTYLPFMNTILGTVPIEAEYWIFPIMIGIIVFIVVEIEKWVTRKVSARLK
ncbi:cation-transporting P-type ATPase [Bacillus sp. B15-48]|uniref:cation-transporting P-type ATPase n=1 Tax=Bacillus sp. B15-48 TaxID=1548601 RepID=UPI00193EE4F0|nr:cation-transporting P-type ATPase [Bacillus sp. B15-48]MBM4761737.1 HAD-IC family P-type ATPase [Bacillus sp. B15-48]